MRQHIARIGQPIERIEDEKFVTGKAKYTDDFTHPEMLHMAVVRSEYPHAKITNIDTKSIRDTPGITAVITHNDIVESTLPTPSNLPIYPAIDVPESLYRPPIASTKTRYVGEPVGIVLASEKYLAHTAATKVSVEYERLEAIVDHKAAQHSEAPQLHESASNNIAFTWETGDKSGVEEAFSQAEHLISIETDPQRIIPNPIEPRATIAEFESATDRLTLRLPSQAPGYFQRRLATIFDHPMQKIRIIVPSIGGGFGTKMILYPAEVLAAWAAMYTEKPVKWQATRTESYQSDSHGRGAGIKGELGVTKSGKILGFRTKNQADLGAYVSERNARLQTGSLVSKLSNQYDIPAIYHHTTGVLTNKPPVDAYRGTTSPRVILTIEQLLDRAANELEIDPAEIRRKNMIQSEQFPYQTASGLVYDTGNYETALDLALESIEYKTLRTRQQELRSENRYLGIGISCFIEPSALGPSDAVAEPHWESSIVTCHTDGSVTAHVGTMDMGTGHPTIYTQIISERLGIPRDDIEIIEGDTDQLSQGTGSFASRSAALGGATLDKSIQKIVKKAGKIAAHQLEVSQHDLDYSEGKFHVTGAPDQSVSIQEIATIAYNGVDLPAKMEPGLKANSSFDPEDVPTSYGTHIAVVEVTPETGTVDVHKYVAVDDCGRQINPTIVEGQLHGGIAQGIGEALFEEAVFADNGTLLTASHQDYTMPKARFLPDIETISIETPTPHNPLGVKGVGEAGTIAAPAAIINAVHDALSPFGSSFIQPPLTPEKIWREIQRTTPPTIDP